MSFQSIDSVILDIARPRHQRRPSRFKEGSEQIGDNSRVTDSFLISVLSEMDRYEERKKSCISLHETSRRHKSTASNSSVESFCSTSTYATSYFRSHHSLSPAVGQRTISFGLESGISSQQSSLDHVMPPRELHHTWHEIKKGLMDKFRAWSATIDKKTSKPYPTPRT